MLIHYVYVNIVELNLEYNLDTVLQVLQKIS